MYSPRTSNPDSRSRGLLATVLKELRAELAFEVDFGSLGAVGENKMRDHIFEVLNASSLGSVCTYPC